MPHANIYRTNCAIWPDTHLYAFLFSVSFRRSSQPTLFSFPLFMFILSHASQWFSCIVFFLFILLLISAQFLHIEMCYGGSYFIRTVSGLICPFFSSPSLLLFPTVFFRFWILFCFQRFSILNDHCFFQAIILFFMDFYRIQLISVHRLRSSTCFTVLISYPS